MDNDSSGRLLGAEIHGFHTLKGTDELLLIVKLKAKGIYALAEKSPLLLI